MGRHSIDDRKDDRRKQKLRKALKKKNLTLEKSEQTQRLSSPVRQGPKANESTDEDPNNDIQTRNCSGRIGSVQRAIVQKYSLTVNTHSSSLFVRNQHPVNPRPDTVLEKTKRDPLYIKMQENKLLKRRAHKLCHQKC